MGRWTLVLRMIIPTPFLLGLLLCGCADDPSGPSVSERVPLGVHPIQRGAPGGDPLLVEAYTDLSQDGFSFAQLELEWGGTERSLGSYDWAYFDNHVRQALARGVGLSVVVLLIEGSRVGELPEDLRGQDLSGINLQVRFARFLQSVVERGRGQVRWLWAGREMDRRLTAHPEEVIPFRSLLAAAADSVHARDPAVRLGVAFAFDPPAPTSLIDELGPVVDRIGWSVWGVDDRFAQVLGADALIDLLRAAVDTPAPVPCVVTETGFRRDTDPGQALEFGRELTRYLETAPERLEAVSWFALYDFHAIEAGARAERIYPDDPAAAEAISGWLRHSGLREVSGVPTSLSILIGDWNLGR